MFDLVKGSMIRNLKPDEQLEEIVSYHCDEERAYDRLRHCFTVRISTFTEVSWYDPNH